MPGQNLDFDEIEYRTSARRSTCVPPASSSASSLAASSVTVLAPFRVTMDIESSELLLEI
jgi:hypothetical protein